MFEREYFGVVQKTPIIFPTYLTHFDIAQAMMILDNTFKPVSAGFCCTDVYVAEEKSVSLNLGPDKFDQENIRCHDYLHGL